MASVRGLSVIDATCPLVSKVHAEARRFAREGYTVALIGHAGHEEVEGTLGEAPESTVLVQTAQDVARLSVEDPAKIAYLMQTTLAIDEAADVAGALRDKFPRMRAPGSDDICYATTNRQAAVRDVAAEADLVLVAGLGELVQLGTARRALRTGGTPAHLIDGATDIDLSWLSGVSVVGLTAGASAPPAVVSEIITALSGLGAGDGHGTSDDNGIGPVRPAPRGPPPNEVHDRRSCMSGCDASRLKGDLIVFSVAPWLRLVRSIDSETLQESGSAS